MTTESKIPLPKARQRVRVTGNGAYNRRCPCGGTASSLAPARGECIYQPASDGVACGRPYTEADWTQGPPIVRTGRVSKITTSTVGTPLVLLKEDGISGLRAVPWSDVVSCEVTS